jgi:hypothetical protein
VRRCPPRQRRASRARRRSGAPQHAGASGGHTVATVVADGAGGPAREELARRRPQDWSPPCAKKSDGRCAGVGRHVFVRATYYMTATFVMHCFKTACQSGHPLFLAGASAILMLWMSR